MKITLDPKNTLCNVGNSILKHFEVPTFHDTYAPLDEVLENNKNKNVCLVLFDGFGKAIIEKYKEYVPFIYSHIFKEFKSVYPPTTVAATTSLTTGKYPLETGYVGWSEYFKKHNDIINVFLSNSKFDQNKFYTPDVRKDILKVDYIWELINTNKKYKATAIHSFDLKGNTEKEILDAFFLKADQLIKTHDFSYVYCTEPDHLMHEYGTISEIVKEMIIYLESKLKKLVNDNPNTIFILHADHGMVDVEDYFIKDHPALASSLESKYTSIEPRFATFKVKDKDAFKGFYEANLKDDFEYKAKEEILNEHTLGYGNPHPLIDEILNDDFLLAKTNKLFNDSANDVKFKGHHAGISKDETSLYMMIFNN